MPQERPLVASRRNHEREAGAEDGRRAVDDAGPRGGASRADEHVVELENYDKIVAKANRGTNCRKTKKRGKDSQKKRRGSKETAGSGDTALDEQIAERRRHESISDACGEDGPDEPDKAADSPAKGGEVRQAEAAS